MHETYSDQSSLIGLEVWPPDDAEESVLGTNLHQLTITNLRLGLNEIAAALARPGGTAPWQALTQTQVAGFARPNGSQYRTYPDVFVFRHGIDLHRGSVTIAVDGPPSLIIEVLSEATYGVDLDLAQGKGFSYARAGVPEYMVIDPEGEIVREYIRAWRLVDDRFQPWTAESDGRWHSQEVEAAFGTEDGLASVYTSDGDRQLREGEMFRERAELLELRRLVEKLKREE
jgi:hypothetical protein